MATVSLSEDVVQLVGKLAEAHKRRENLERSIQINQQRIDRDNMNLDAIADEEAELHNQLNELGFNCGVEEVEEEEA